MAVAEEGLVMVHGRYVEWAPKPMIAVDIVRIEDGKVAEHWDVMQEEAVQAASGHPMLPQRTADPKAPHADFMRRTLTISITSPSLSHTAASRRRAGRCRSRTPSLAAGLPNWRSGWARVSLNVRPGASGSPRSGRRSTSVAAA